MKKYLLILILAIVMSILITGCSPTDEPNPKPTDPTPEDGTLDLSYREDRDFTVKSPTDEIDEESLPTAREGSVTQLANAIRLKSGDINYEIVQETDGYIVRMTDNSDSVLYVSEKPVKVYLRASPSQTVEGAYDSASVTRYGALAVGRITSGNGSILRIEDRYYYPEENVSGTVNVRRAVIVENASTSDRGYESLFQWKATALSNDKIDWFVPNNIFGEYPDDTDSKIYQETLLGVPMIMMRDGTSGYTMSLARYQPIINMDTVASISAIRCDSDSGDDRSGIEITYPSQAISRRVFSMDTEQIVYDMSIRGELTVSMSSAMVNTYNAHYLLQNQRIVATDIDEVFTVINEDYKDFMLANTVDKRTSYGLPWRVTVETGKLGPRSYQAGFVGQQIPAAYSMMLYGIMNNDKKSFENGENIIDFWIEAGMMTSSGVPKIWYNGDWNVFNAYPTFLRMAVDAMEGLLDGYRLLSAHGYEKTEWKKAIEAFGEFLVKKQNSDGSYYRCYNWDGGYFKHRDNGINEPGGNICQSRSKLNTTMPVRFLGKMYEMTGNDEYKQAAIAGGEYVYRVIYPTNVYTGGTCDNANAVDKEAGVYAMYCYDTMYTLTGESKWINCLKQATAFTMSTVHIFSFYIRESASDLLAAYPLKYGYTDGCSFIVCGSTGVDNYIAYIYYELFRIYIITGEEIYLKQAEFIQQNTKSIMDWDGAMGYPYKSLVAEATTIYSFGFSSALDDEGIMGVWLPWSSVANAEPIAKMLTGFGEADVTKVAHTYSVEQLRQTLEEIGVGGYTHRVYLTTVFK